MLEDPKIQLNYSRCRGRHLRCIKADCRRAATDDVVAETMLYVGKEIKSDYVDMPRVRNSSLQVTSERTTLYHKSLITLLI